MSEPLKVLAVCGVGMGSSLILKMTAETALQDLGVEAEVDNTDVSSARSMAPDVVIGQGMHTEDLDGVAPIVVTITDFLDTKGLADKLREPLREKGWLK